MEAVPSTHVKRRKPERQCKSRGERTRCLFPPELVDGQKDVMLDLIFILDSGRSDPTVRLPDGQKFRSMPSFLLTLPPAVRFRASEWIDTQRKAWAHMCRVRASGPVLPQQKRRPNQTAVTPPSVYEFLRNKEWGWGLELSAFDPCPADHEGESGLAVPWQAGAGATVYVNPPFSQCKDWVRYALGQIRAGHVEQVAFMLPARTYPHWFHDEALPFTHRIVHARGSVRFFQPDGTPFPKRYPWGVSLLLLRGKRLRPSRFARMESFDFVKLDRKLAKEHSGSSSAITAP